MQALIPILIVVGKAVGSALLNMLIAVLTGRTLKQLIVWVGRKLTRWTRTKKDDVLLARVQEDLDVGDLKE